MNKEESLAELRRFAHLSYRRNFLVRESRSRGATWSEIIEASGLAKQTVANILKSAPKEEPVQTTDTAQHFPHHSHFVHVARGSYGAEYTFREFTGQEPEPVEPNFPGTDDKAVYEEWRQRCDEIRAARRSWSLARYRVEMAPLFRMAAQKWPQVANAVATMREAYAALDSATVWEPAVKRLLDTQDAALKAMGDWDDTVARDIARTVDQQPSCVWDVSPSWRRSAQDAGFDSADWQVGTYYGDGYDDGPLSALESEIEKQKSRLREIRSYSRVD